MSSNEASLSPLRYFISRLLILLGVAMLSYFIFNIFGMLLLKPLFGLEDIATLNNYETNISAVSALKFLNAFVSVGAMVIPALIFPWIVQHERMSFLGINNFYSLKYFVLAIMLMIVSSPFISWLVDMNSRLLLPESFSAIENLMKEAEETAGKITRAFMQNTGLGGYFVNILVIAFIPALCEELFFRGSLQQLMKLCFDKSHLAVWVTAAIFSAMHFQFYGFLPRLFLGVFLGYMFEYSGSLWLNITAHFFNNLMALTMTYFHWDTSSDMFKDEYVFPWYGNILSVLLCAGIIYMMHQSSKIRIAYAD